MFCGRSNNRRLGRARRIERRKTKKWERGMSSGVCLRAGRVVRIGTREGGSTAAMRRLAPRFLLTLVTASTLWTSAIAQEYGASNEQHLSDLTLGNLFSEGWGQPWAKRERADGTPDMALLKVTTNFLEREVRLDYARTNSIKNSKYIDSDFLNGLIAYGLNRRLMIEVISNYQWNTPAKVGGAVSGAGGGGVLRFQLIDTEPTSLALQLRLNEPNQSIGQTQTSRQVGLAGFSDLTPLAGLSRTGLYYSVVFESLVGKHANGARESDIAYDISLAKTLTERDTPVFGNFTTFLEALATTDLDGAKAGHTVATVTPGVRFWFYPENSLMVGGDIPVSGPHPFGGVFRVTYILNF